MNLFDFYIPEWFFVALNLVILVFVLTKLLWKPVNKILDARQEKIATALAEAEAIRAEKLEMESQRAEHEAELDRFTAEQMKDARTRAGKEYDNIVSKAEQQAKAIIQSAHIQAEREREGMLREAKRELVNAALEAASALLGARMDGEANERFVETVLARRDGNA